MNKKLTFAVLGALMNSSVQAATVFIPTDTTVNFIEFFGSSSALIGIFDDSDPGFSGGYLAIQASGDQATFTPSGVNYSVVNASALGPNTFTLSGSNYFTLAAWSPGQNAWLAPDAVTCSSFSGSCSVSWSGLLVELAVDLDEAPPFSAVSAPPSMTLFGAGILGLATVARRRTTGNRLTSG